MWNLRGGEWRVWSARSRVALPDADGAAVAICGRPFNFFVE
jgi:hypothetical protein